MHALERKTQWGREAGKKVGRRSVFLAVLGRGQNSPCKLSSDDRTMGEETERNRTSEREARVQRQTFDLQSDSEPEKVPNTPENDPCLPTTQSASLQARASLILHNHSQPSKNTKSYSQKSKKQQLTQPFSFPSLHSSPPNHSSSWLGWTAAAAAAPLATPLTTPTPRSHDCLPKRLGRRWDRHTPH